MATEMYQNRFEQSEQPEGQIKANKTISLKTSSFPEDTSEISSQSSDDVNESDVKSFPKLKRDKVASQYEIIDALEEAYKKDKNLYITFIKYTRKKIFKIMGKANSSSLNAEDIVQEAIARIIDKKRKWYRDKVEKIEHLILMVIVSLIRIERDKIPGNNGDQLYNPNEAGNTISKKFGTNNPKIIPLHFIDDDNPNSDITIADIENYKINDKERIEDEFDFEKIEVEETIIKLGKKLEEEDEIGYFVFEELLKDNKSDIKIAKELGIEINEVRNAKKRIKRKVINLNKR